MAVTPFLLGAIARGYFDFVPTALMLGALVAILGRRAILGFVLLGLAVMTKGYAIVVVPVAVAWLVARGERRRALQGAAAMVATMAVVLGAAMLLSPSGVWYAFHYQIARPAEVESTPALLLFAADWTGGVRHGSIVHTYGSWNRAPARGLRSPGESGERGCWRGWRSCSRGSGTRPTSATCCGARPVRPRSWMRATWR